MKTQYREIPKNASWQKTGIAYTHMDQTKTAGNKTPANILVNNKGIYRKEENKILICKTI